MSTEASAPRPLSRFEVSRVLGIRSLQLQEGSLTNVHVKDTKLRQDFTYVAALELLSGLLDARILRGAGSVHVRDCGVPPCVRVLLDTRDGGSRD